MPPGSATLERVQLVQRARVTVDDDRVGVASRFDLDVARDRVRPGFALAREVERHPHLRLPAAHDVHRDADPVSGPTPPEPKSGCSPTARPTPRVSAFESWATGRPSTRRFHALSRGKILHPGAAGSGSAGVRAAATAAARAAPPAATAAPGSSAPPPPHAANSASCVNARFDHDNLGKGVEELDGRRRHPAPERRPRPAPRRVRGAGDGPAVGAERHPRAAPARPARDATPSTASSSSAASTSRTTSSPTARSRRTSRRPRPSS